MPQNFTVLLKLRELTQHAIFCSGVCSQVFDSIEWPPAATCVSSQSKRITMQFRGTFVWIIIFYF